MHAIRTFSASRTKERTKEGDVTGYRILLSSFTKERNFCFRPFAASLSRAPVLKPPPPHHTHFLCTLPPSPCLLLHLELRRDKQFETTGPASWNLMMAISECVSISACYAASLYEYDERFQI